MTIPDDLAPEAGERTSYLTAAEVRAAQVLHQRAPYAICRVSEGFFSIARYYGGLTYNGCSYTYMGSEHDECVRDDVLRLVTQMRKLATKRAEVVTKQDQLGMDL